MSVLAKLRPIVVQPLGKHTASLIFLHGSGKRMNSLFYEFFYRKPTCLPLSDNMISSIAAHCYRDIFKIRTNTFHNQ